MINKILIIGYGSIGKKYYKIIKSEYKKIKVCVFTSQDNLNINGIKTFSEIILFKPDLTIFCNPSSKRLKIFDIIKKTKSHILFEKPLTNTFRGVKKINEPKDKIYRVGYNLRQLKILKKFKSLINNNKIGNIHCYNIEAGEYLPNWRKKEYSKTVSAKRELGGGVILELSHEIDYAHWIFGKISKIKAIFGKFSNLNIDTEDIAKILFLSKKKILGSINLDFLSHDKKRFCHVVGSKGELLLNFIKKNIQYYDITKNKWKIIYKSNQNVNETYLIQVNEMIKLINNKKFKNNLGTIKNSRNILNIINKIKVIKK